MTMALKRKQIGAELPNIPAKRIRSYKDCLRKYANHSLEDLGDLIDARGLQKHVKDIFTKKQLIAALVRHDRQTFYRFPDLPAELRNTIYEYALIDHIRVTPGPPRAPPSIARANSLLRSEALSVFFSRNRFEISLYARSYGGSNIYYRLQSQHRRDLNRFGDLELLNAITIRIYIDIVSNKGVQLDMTLQRQPEPSCSIVVVKQKRYSKDAEVAGLQRQIDETGLEIVTILVNTFLQSFDEVVFDEGFFRHFCREMKSWRKFFRTG